MNLEAKIEACKYCSRLRDIEGNNYCYMFEQRPQTVPCGQHDKFKVDREVTGQLVIKRPELLTASIMGVQDKL